MDATNRTHKIVFLGEFQVGKTSIINRKLHCDMGDVQPTVAYDHKKITVHVLDDDIILDVFDTAGQEKYNSLTNNITRNCNIFIFIYSINGSDQNYGFDKVKQLYDQIKETTQIDLTFVVQNKIDLISESDIFQAGTMGRNWCMEHSAYFHQTSAKTGKNINELFAEIAQMAQQLQKANELANNIILNNRDGEKQFCNC